MITIWKLIDESWELVQQVVESELSATIASLRAAHPESEFRAEKSNGGMSSVLEV